MQRRAGFPYPFVADVDLALGGVLNLILAPRQLQPAIFAINKKREIVWMQRGRNGSYYGDKQLMQYLGCEFDLAFEGE